MAITSLRDAIRKVMGYKDDIGNNPNQVTAAQIDAYTVEETHTALSPTVQAGDWPISAFGDMGFSLPNISSRYEGATTYALPVVYQMEQDGSRNFLRSGCDGQIYGVYLCKMQVNILRKLTGYNPMATPWRPAYLAVNESLIAVCRGLSGQVVAQASDAAGNLSIRISLHNGTLDPVMHTAALTVPVPPFFDVHRTLFIREDNVVWALSPATDGSVSMDVRRSDNGGAWVAVTNWSGVDVCGVSRSTMAMLTLATTYLGDDSSTGYMLRNPDVALASVMQSGRQYTDAIYVSPGKYRLHLYHEILVQTTTSASARELILREIDIDLNASTFTLTAESQGQMSSETTGGVPSIIGGAKLAVNIFGLVTWGNRTYQQSRCMTSGEVLITTFYPGYGLTNPQYSPDLTWDQWFNPRTRPAGHAQGLAYNPSFASPVGASLKAARALPSGDLTLNSTAGNSRLTSPQWSNPIDYVHPDGSQSKWAVDSGRAVITQKLSTQFYGIHIAEDDTVRYIGTLTEDRLTTNDSYDDLVDPIGNDYSTTAQVIATMVAYVKALGESKGWVIGGTKVALMRTNGIKRLGNRILVTGQMMGSPNNNYAYVGLFDATWSGNTITALAATPAVEYIRIVGSNATNYSIARYTGSAGSITVGEMDDCTVIGGTYPYLVSFAGASGLPGLAVAITGTDAAPVLTYITYSLASVNANGGTLEIYPKVGCMRRDMAFDNMYAQTSMTYDVYGRSLANIVGLKTQSRLVIASQAIFGSWNLYISEDIAVVIMGVPDTIQRLTFDLRAVKADPTNTTFYLYAYLGSNGRCAYSLQLTKANSPNYVLAAVVVTDATRIVSVDVRKTFAIAGISISSTNEPYSIPGKSAAG